MTFDPDARIDSSRVRRSSGGRGKGIAVGGGLGGIVIVVITLLLGGDPSSVIGQLGGGEATSQDSGSGTIENCDTGADANANVDCRVTATVNSLDQVWDAELAAQTGVPYERPEVDIFSGQVSTGCGAATSDVGPFYCPADSTAYFDTGFFQVLVDQFGSSGGPLAQEYVVAHEFGHHIQNQLGDIGRAQADPNGPESGAVRTELQADCYAGVWANKADDIPAPGSSEPLLDPLTDQDVSDALSAASSVGDDRIQQASTGRVNPEGWTHGSSDQRQAWFDAGYRTGAVAACNTYDASDLNDPSSVR
ncbi:MULTISPECIES: neutral zinc metallopeptidase [Nocardiaceae]|uniref:Metalloprotease n=1 Tax=Rhodococcoides corynebacterioides TaxID=53972 RepID=A0ABS2KRY5_9NOCA|nr:MULTISPECIES: neutral zinc metallopeptidase [Rhodococcus]MBM7414720.1 putative metalloprotease [Rhodococcus corynebacterioides]MBP1117182.1 putative metalloprotease [Rhodococcus sp. PvP016]